MCGTNGDELGKRPLCGCQDETGVVITVTSGGWGGSEGFEYILDDRGITPEGFFTFGSSCCFRQLNPTETNRWSGCSQA